MDLKTRQEIIDKIRACPRERVEASCGAFDSDELYEQFKQFSIGCIEKMDDDHELLIRTIETGEVELCEVDVNRYLQVFDPVIIDD